MSPNNKLNSFASFTGISVMLLAQHNGIGVGPS